MDSKEDVKYTGPCQGNKILEISGNILTSQKNLSIKKGLKDILSFF